MSSPRVRLLTVGTAVLLAAVAACGKAPDGGGSGGGEYGACMITDIGGIDDRSFNAAVWQGLGDAADQDSNVEPSYRTSESSKDYEPNLKQSVKKDCDVIVAVGGLMADATKKVAEENPDQHFIIVDAVVDLPNVYSVEFDTAQAAFLAGYLAAGMSKSGKVATFGAQQIDPVTIFMDGFAEGVTHYNDTKDKSVSVLGWNPDTQKGNFVGSFTDQSGAEQTTKSLLSQDADIVLPVAGNASLGAAAAAKDADSTVIWVDFDGCESAEQYCDLFLTSVIKRIPDVIADSVADAVDGSPRDGAYVGTLDNDGVAIAPFHDFDAKVPEALKTELQQVTKDITDGTITVKSPASP